MNHRNGWLAGVAMLAVSAWPGVATALPDIPFCPLGGPPGWIDRLTDDDDDHYPPPYYPPPPVLPYWTPGYPGVYGPPYPVYAPYLHR